MTYSARCQLHWCLAADIVMFRDPFDRASNPLADAEMYFSMDAGPTDAEAAGTVNTGMIGMRDGPAVSEQCLDMPWCVTVVCLQHVMPDAPNALQMSASQLLHINADVPSMCAGTCAHLAAPVRPGRARGTLT